MKEHTNSTFLNYIALALICLTLGFSAGKALSPDTASGELSYISKELRDLRIDTEEEYGISPEMFASSMHDAFDGQLSWKEIRQRIDAIDHYVTAIADLEHEVNWRIDELEGDD